MCFWQGCSQQAFSPAMAAMAEEADGKVLDIALSADISTMDVMGNEQGLHGSDEMYLTVCLTLR